MADLDIILLPFIGVRTGLHMHCKFFLPLPRNDFERHVLMYVHRERRSLYPVLKDIDNMLKFFMDSLALALTALLMSGSVKPTLQTTFMAKPGGLRSVFPASSRRCDHSFYY
jgi:hypothetical protein